MYLIARCPSCGKIIMANAGNKTRSCPHCGHRADVPSLKVLARARTSQEAVETIQRLKEQQSDADWEPRFKKFKP
jgi:predicted RNA-binding Zn-ribbon protein involved in translation (DUF1610 family)